MLQETFVIAVISPDPRVNGQIAAVLEESPQAGSFWSLTDYPGPDQLQQIRDAPSGSVVFLDFCNAVRAKAVAHEIDHRCPAAVTIAVLPYGSNTTADELLDLGVRGVVSMPLNREQVEQAFQRAVRKLNRQGEPDREGNPLYAFLPARPGCGATTIAAYSAAAVARLSNQPTLLIDFDFRYGMTSFLFRLHSEHSVLEALACSQNLDAMWDHVVCHRGPLDILGSAAVDSDREVPSMGIVPVLDFARRRYQTVCVDLPGEIRDHELEVLKLAKEIFLVCTPELGVLHLARRKSEMLQALGYQGKATAILNHAHGRSSMPLADIEEILQLPVRFTVPNGEREIAQATLEAIPVEGRSAVARQIEAVAKRMMPTQKAVSLQTKARRFLETFSVTPAREKASWWR